MTEVIDPRRVKITTQPSIEPVTTAEAKLHCRIDQSTEDTIVDRLIETARQQCEDIARRAFITRTYTAYLDCWPYMTRFELPYPPLLGITSVKYYDDAGSPSVTYSSSNYQVDAHSEPGRFALKNTASWPSVSLRDLNGVEIIYTAGYGALATDVPDRYKAAILLTVAHLYEHREAVVVEQGVSLAQLPQGVYDLLMTDRGGW
jgi:uncharacterized phiE125 gp8 family phage protein